MILTINNSDYSAYLSPGAAITRKLNTPAACAFVLVAADAGFATPPLGARIVLTTGAGTKLFTGYLSSPPVLHYQGWNHGGQVYRYECSATGDEYILDIEPLPARPDFTNRPAGAALRALASSVAPGAFDLSAVQDLETLPQFTPARESKWSTHAAHLARRTRAVYRAHNGGIVFAPIASVTHNLSEADPAFTPDGLTFTSAKAPAAQITALSALKDEPRLYCKDYFVAYGTVKNYSLAHALFSQTAYTIVEENFSSALSPLLWNITDPTGALSVSNGKLLIAGGPGAATDGALAVSFAEQVELAANATLDHGYAIFSGSCSGILGGLYNGAVATANCLAGFHVTADSSGNASITAVVNGVLSGSPQSVAALAPIALTTRFYCREPYRATEPFHSSVHPAGSARGGASIASDVRVVLSIAPADGSAATPTVLYDAILPNAPAFCSYALVNGGVFNASLSHTRIARENTAEVQTTTSGVTRTRIQGSSTGGAECVVLTSTRTLRFYSSSGLAAGDSIVCRYRSSGRAVAMAVAGPAGPSTGRVLTRTIIEPPLRTTADCENAALALLDDSSAAALAGEYKCWSDSLDSDVFPGDALALNLPSRGINLAAGAAPGLPIVREVGIELPDLSTDHAQYAIKFSNDAAAALSFEFERAGTTASRPLAPAIIVPVAGTTYLPNLVNAEVTSVSSGIVNVDCGVAPPAGGGIEVRRTDFGWGLSDGYNLVGRFTGESFQLAKLTPIVDYYLRQYDSNGNYSRYSTALHVDMP